MLYHIDESVTYVLIKYLEILKIPLDTTEIQRWDPSGVHTTQGMVPPPPPAPGSNPPCSTLFVANLGPTCTEEDLTQLLSRSMPIIEMPGLILQQLLQVFGLFKDWDVMQWILKSKSAWVRMIALRCFSHLLYMGFAICRYPGYLKLKYQLKGGLPVAFVEFQVGLPCCCLVLLTCQNHQQCSVFERHCTRLHRLYWTRHTEAW